MMCLATMLSFITTITAYNPGDIAQTDNTPCIAASGVNICETEKQVCASNYFPMGSKLYIQGFGQCEVLDRMNSRYNKRVDVAFEEYDKAIEWGKKRRRVYLIKEWKE